MNPDDDTLWTEAHNRHKERFEQSLLYEEDDLGAVVRAQVFVEYYLRRCIEAACRDKSRLTQGVTWNRVHFETRLELAMALGLELDVKTLDALGFLAKLRNRLAHRVGEDLEEAQGRGLLGRLSQRMQADLVKLRQPEDDWHWDFRTALFLLVQRVRIETAMHKARWDQAKALVKDSWELKPQSPADIARQILELTDKNVSGDD